MKMSLKFVEKKQNKQSESRHGVTGQVLQLNEPPVNFCRHFLLFEFSNVHACCHVDQTDHKGLADYLSDCHFLIGRYVLPKQMHKHGTYQVHYYPQRILSSPCFTVVVKHLLF